MSIFIILYTIFNNIRNYIIRIKLILITSFITLNNAI